MIYGGADTLTGPLRTGSYGAAFHADLVTETADLIVRKGYCSVIDSYSASFENDRTTPTGLHGCCREHEFEMFTLVGVALDFCVLYSALDVRRLGYRVRVMRAGVSCY